MARRAWLVPPALLVASGLALAGAAPALGAPCTFPTAIGVDVANVDTFMATQSCRGWGQVFLASDTLIESISVWRPWYPGLDGQPRYLLILGTLAGNDRVPDVNRLLLDAGPRGNEIGEGIHPVEYRWVFDPPFALPHKGRFLFDILAPDFAILVAS